MLFERNEFEGLCIINPIIFNDARGCFYETYNKIIFQKNGINTEFVQDNQSLSKKNVLRGLHFQKNPHSQGKLVRVIQGSVLDVVVDIRKSSETFGKHFKIKLSSENNTMLYIPEGFAHGFLALEDNTIFSYKCTNFYNKESECSILWSDKSLSIDWGIENPILTDKDHQASSFTDSFKNF
ncbi:MAG: dTDP-4-dehydrorhamnose 3,5-epimerase [Flavobacteriales bacterium]|nr:dTDP-4-dehydrorhamnose 3,5-epimerase [Flavobacteriales bacterium]